MTQGSDPNLLNEIFNQRAVVLTFFGALGGSVRAAVLKTTWREGLRVVFVGGAVAFGVGILGPVLLQPWIGEIPEGMSGAIGTLTAAAFLIGLVAVTLVERFISGDQKNDET
jgi:drug/metabolite transporter (DMT)-like permease